MHDANIYANILEVIVGKKYLLHEWSSDDVFPQKQDLDQKEKKYLN